MLSRGVARSQRAVVVVASAARALPGEDTVLPEGASTSEPKRYVILHLPNATRRGGDDVASVPRLSMTARDKWRHGWQWSRFRKI